MRVWSLSTSVRSPERLMAFLKAFQEVNTGHVWDSHKKQRLYAHLVRARIIRPHPNGLPIVLQSKLKMPDYQLTPDDVWMLLEHRDLHNIGSAIGNILAHLRRWKMIEELPGAPIVNGDRAYQITGEGQALLAGTLPFNQHMMRQLLYWRFPTDEEYRIGRDLYHPIRPYVATLALIMEVNRLCRKDGLAAVGLWRDEFDLCALTCLDSHKIQYQAECALEYRVNVAENPQKDEQQKDMEYYLIMDRLEQAGFSGIRNATDYTDILFRYFALSKYFVFPNNRNQIDINPQYHDEITKVIGLFLHN